MTPLYNIKSINSSLLIQVKLILIIYSVTSGKAERNSVLDIWSIFYLNFLFLLIFYF